MADTNEGTDRASLCGSRVTNDHSQPVRPTHPAHGTRLKVKPLPVLRLVLQRVVPFVGGGDVRDEMASSVTAHQRPVLGGAAGPRIALGLPVL
jgi:hypothetical protein